MYSTRILNEIMEISNWAKKKLNISQKPLKSRQLKTFDVTWLNKYTSEAEKLKQARTR